MDMRDSPSAWEPGAKGPRPEVVAQLADAPASDSVRLAKFGIGQVVKHRVFSFRGVIFDVDPVFANTEDWWLAIPAEITPAQGPAVLPPAGRERRRRLRRLRLRAEPAGRHHRRAGRQSQHLADLRRLPPRPVPPAPPHHALAPPHISSPPPPRGRGLDRPPAPVPRHLTSIWESLDVLPAGPLAGPPVGPPPSRETTDRFFLTRHST